MEALLYVFFGEFVALWGHKMQIHISFQIVDQRGYIYGVIFLDHVEMLHVPYNLSSFDIFYHKMYKSNNYLYPNPGRRLDLNAKFFSIKRTKNYYRQVGNSERNDSYEM